MLFFKLLIVPGNNTILTASTFSFDSTHRSHVHNTFLDNGILESMKLWLEPLQDASLPSLDIIQDFLDILDIV